MGPDCKLSLIWLSGDLNFIQLSLSDYFQTRLRCSRVTRWLYVYCARYTPVMPNIHQFFQFEEPFVQFDNP